MWTKNEEKSTPSVYLYPLWVFLPRKGIKSLKNSGLSFLFKNQKKSLFVNQKKPFILAA
jgi:hypothetical protein